MRGLLSGGAWGLILGGATVVGVSLVGETPAGNAPPDAPLVTAPETATQAEVASTTPSEAPDVDATQTATTAPRVAAPDAVEAPVLADTDPAALPTTGDVVDTPRAPQVGAAPQVIADAEEPVLPNPQSVAPQIPVAEDDLIVATAPADPPAPEVIVVEDVPDVNVVGEDAPEQDAPEAAPEDTPEVVIVDTPDETEPEVADAPQALAAPADDTTTAVIEAAPEETSAALTAPQEPVAPAADATIVAPETPAAPEVPETAAPQTDAPVIDTPTAEADPEPEAAPAADPAPEPETGPQAAPDTETAAAEPDETTPDPTTPTETTVVTIVPEAGSNLPTGDSSVTIRRPASDATPEEVAITPEATPLDDGTPAITRYGIPADNPDGKPTVAVVLIDDDSFAGAIPAIAGIPFAVTVVLNPSAPDIAEKMVAYRAAGVEVAVLAQIPDGAQPADIEVYFEGAFAALPETVAVLDLGGALTQSGNDAISQAVGAIAENGRGLITESRGLNATLREASKAGVPTGIIYRDLDGEGQDARVIRRFMDQAAFRARQESGVVLLGRIRADTISALILWGTANRAGQVALVPVTSVLTDG